MRFDVSDGRIAQASVTNQGLDDGIHQIDFLGDFLLVADCHNGRILKMRPGSQEFEAFYPLGQLTRKAAWAEYHMNSMAAHPDGTLWLLLHNSLRKPSEIAIAVRRMGGREQYTQTPFPIATPRTQVMLRSAPSPLGHEDGGSGTREFSPQPHPASPSAALNRGSRQIWITKGKSMTEQFTWSQAFIAGTGVSVRTVTIDNNS